MGLLRRGDRAVTGKALRRDWSWCPGAGQGVDRTDDPFPAAHVEHVGVDHGRLDVFVAEQFLDGADVVPGHQEVGGKRVAHGMAAGSFGNARSADGLFDGLLDNRWVQVVAANGVGPGVSAARASGEDVLPAPVGGGIRVLARQGRREVDPAEAVGDVLIVEIADVVEVVLEPLTAGVGEECRSVFVTLAVADGDVAEVEIDVLDAEAEALKDPHSGAVEQQDDELHGALEA